MLVDVVAHGCIGFAFVAYFILCDGDGGLSAARLVLSTGRLGAGHDASDSRPVYATILTSISSAVGWLCAVCNGAPAAERNNRAPHCQLGSASTGLWPLNQCAAAKRIGCLDV